jgi:hypothetical protein
MRSCRANQPADVEMNLAAADETLARSCRFNQQRIVHAPNPGNALGDRAGGSLLFQDHRPYFPGDDIRRIDWRAYGRTDQLVLKTYQEEIAPFFELLVDVSASMALTPAKREAVTRWTWFCLTVALQSGYTVHVQRLGLDRAPLRPEELAHSPWKFDPDHDLPGALRREWKGRYHSIRVVLGDFFWDPNLVESVLSTVARDAMVLYGLQVLDPAEIDPPWRGAYRLVEADGAGVEQLHIGQREVEQYRDRLGAFQTMLSGGFRRRGGAFAVVNAAHSSRDILMRQLVPAGIIRLA